MQLFNPVVNAKKTLSYIYFLEVAVDTFTYTNNNYNHNLYHYPKYAVAGTFHCLGQIKLTFYFQLVYNHNT